MAQLTANNLNDQTDSHCNSKEKSAIAKKRKKSSSMDDVLV